MGIGHKTVIGFTTVTANMRLIYPKWRKSDKYVVELGGRAWNTSSARFDSGDQIVVMGARAVRDRFPSTHHENPPLTYKVHPFDSCYGEFLTTPIAVPC